MVRRKSGSTEGLEKDYQEFLSGEMGIIMQVGVLYSSDLEPAIRHSTFVAYNVKRDDASLVRRKMD